MTIVQTMPIINIQSICDYMLDINGPRGKIMRWVKDFPCIRPPFPHMLMFYDDNRAPRDSRFNGSVKTELWVSEIDSENLSIEVCYPQISNKSVCKISFKMGPSGEITENPMCQSLSFEDYDKSLDKETTNMLFASKVSIAAMAICFMHVKGTKVEAPDFPTRQARRKYNRLTPDQQYKVLKVEPIERVLRESKVGNGSKKRLHIVRGHFKDCREHGIAGNPKARGIYWWQPMIRGSKEVGMVAKEYKTGMVTA